MDASLVSVIVPTYNTDPVLLDRCIKSILNQNYLNIEVLIVDDGSSLDYSQSIVTNYKDIEKIFVFHRDNGGVAKARNYGIEMAKGEFVTFVDADDCVNESWISTSVKLANQYSADIVYGIVQRIYNTGARVSINQTASKVESVIFNESELSKLQNLLLCNNFSPLKNMKYVDVGPYGKLFRKNIIQKIKFPEDITIAEDQVFNHRALEVAKCCCLSDAVSYYYFQNPTSVSHNFHADAVEVMLKSLDEIKKTLIDESCSINFYNYCVLYNIIVAAGMQFFRDKSEAHTIISKYVALKNLRKNIKIKKALKQIKLRKIPRSNTVIKVFMLKYFPSILTIYMNREQMLSFLSVFGKRFFHKNVD